MIKESTILNPQTSENKPPAESFSGEKEEFEDIYEKDEANIEKIINLLNKEEQKSATSSHINQILEDFKTSQKTKQDFDQMMKRFMAMKINGAVYQEGASKERKQQVKKYLDNKDRSWSQEQVDEIIGYFEKYESDEILAQKNDQYHGHYFWDVFSTGRKEKKEQTTISDLVAKHLAERIEKGGRLPEALQEEVRGWCQNIQMIDSDIRFDFLSSILNNPGKVSGHTVGEAIGNLGLYGAGFIRQLEDTLKKNKNNIGKALKAITILNYLRHKKDQAGFNDSGNEALKILYETKDKTNNYFIKTKTTQILKKPLEDYTVKEKRIFLKGDWKNIIQPNNFYDTIQPVLGENDPYEAIHIDPMDETMLLDKEVNAIFDRYRDMEAGYYYWNEREQMKGRYEHGDLRRDYNIIPQTAEHNYYENKITREACYARMNSNYGVIYTSDGQVDSFFELNPKLEAQSLEEIKKNGNINENTLEFFVDKFNKAQKSGDSEQFLYYLQIRNRLSGELKEKIDSHLGLNIPKELDRNFTTKTEFDDELEKYKESLLKDLSESLVKKTNFLTSELKNLLEQRKQTAKEKYFGFASEDIEILNFFNSFNMNPPDRVGPTAHHTICYYLYLRKDLPEDLTQEFEEKFDVKIPENLKEFGTFDEYLATSDHELLAPFMNYSNFREMSAWLNQRIGNLSKKIKETKETPERLNISEILEKEGFKKEEMSEEEYNKLLLTYKTLIELPLRASVEKDFEIKLKDYSIREQVQFVNFLSTKTIEEVKRVKDFLNQADDENDKKNRVKSFLSLESGDFSGEDILKIGEELKDDPELRIILFSEYAGIVDSAEEKIEEFSKIYKEVFFDKEIDEDKIRESLLREGSELLKKAITQLNDAEEDKKSEIIKNLISDLRRQDKVQAKILNDLKTLKQNIDKEQQKLFDSAMEEIFPNATYETYYERGLYKDFLDLMDEEQKSLFALKFITTLPKSTLEKNPTLMNCTSYEDLWDEFKIPKEVMQKRYIKFCKDQLSMEGETQQREEKANKWENKYNKYKDLQTDIKNKLDQIIYGEESKETTSPIFKKYQEIIDQAKNVSKERIIHLLSGKRSLSEEELNKITDSLLEKANDIMSKEIDNLINNEDEVKDEISLELKKIDSKVILLGEIIRNLPREEVADLDLAAIKDIEKIENVSAKELQERKDILAKMLDIVEKQFPGNPRFEFLEELESGELKLNITLVKNEPLCFFSKKTIGEGVEYLDWFGANPKAPIKGLGEATAKNEFFKKENKKKLYYAVAKPHVKSFEILIEKMGFISFDGCTKDGEYSHHYSRCRRTPENQKLKTKSLNKEQEISFKKIVVKNCSEINNFQKLKIDGKTFLASKIKYSNKNFQDDINKDDPEGWLMREIDKKYQEGYVLSRFISEKKTKDNEIFYVVFEKDQISEENKIRIEKSFGSKSSEKRAA